MKEKYIALRKTDWIIIIFLFLLPFPIKILTNSFQKSEVYYQIKHYIGNQLVIDNIESNNQSPFIIKGEKGSLILEFDKEKGVRVASSSCPCKVCINNGWTKSEAVVCVPNSVIIQPIVKNKETSHNPVDGVTR